MKPMSEQVFTTKYIPYAMGPKGIKLCFIGDVHSETGGHCDGAFQEALEEWKEDISNEACGGPHLGVVFMGDEADTASTSERKGMEAAGLHGATKAKLDKTILSEIKEFKRKIDFLDGRLLGMIQGNHHWSFQTDLPAAGIHAGMTSTRWLCDNIGCHWLGFLTYIRLAAFRDSARFPLDIAACHGKAGAKLVGTSLNQIVDLKLIFPRADIFAMGHDHQLGAWKTNSLEIPSGAGAFDAPKGMADITTGNMAHLRVAHQEQAFLRTGSFLRGYDPGVPSYPVGSLFRPTAIGMARVTAKIQKRSHQVGEETKIESMWKMETGV